MARTFTDSPARRAQIPLLLGICGPSTSGKTYSALRLATGIAKVIGGPIFFIDTEARRGLHYSDRFEFRHVPFDPPFGPLDYVAAIEHCVAKGARVLVVDSMTHEHSGTGGVMDQSEQFLARKCGDDLGARQKNFMMSLIAAKAQRKKLNSRIVQLGINAIFCYRAAERIKPVPGKEPVNMGWTPETTSPLIYEMAQQFLLGPGSDGVPTFKAETASERQLIKTPEQFRGWFKPGDRLDESIGERMARWAAGDGAAVAAAVPPIPTPPAARAVGDTAARQQEIFDAGESLGWNGARGLAWLRETFGVAAIADLTDQQLTDARDLMIDRTIGESLYEDRLSELARDGRVKVLR